MAQHFSFSSQFQPEIPSPKFRHFVRTSQTWYFSEKNVGFQKPSFFRKLQVVWTGGTRFGIHMYAELQRLRATCQPRTYRFGIPAASHIRERTLPSDEFVSPRLRRKLRHRRGRTNSSIEDASSRMWPVRGILKRFVRGGLVARALWIQPKPKSGTSRAGDL